MSDRFCREIAPGFAIGEDRLQWIIFRKTGRRWKARRFHMDREAMINITFREMVGLDRLYPGTLDWVGSFAPYHGTGWTICTADSPIASKVRPSAPQANISTSESTTLCAPASGFVRLILHQSEPPGVYEAVREDSGAVVCLSRQPLYDGARVLLKQGLPGQTLLTMRHISSIYDSWVPARIDELAKWTVEESNRGGLRRKRWQPHPRSTPEGLAKPAGEPPGARLSLEGRGSRGPGQIAEFTRVAHSVAHSVDSETLIRPRLARSDEWDERAP